MTDLPRAEIIMRTSDHIVHSARATIRTSDGMMHDLQVRCSTEPGIDLYVLPFYRADASGVTLVDADGKTYASNYTASLPTSAAQPVVDYEAARAALEALAEQLKVMPLEVMTGAELSLYDMYERALGSMQHSLMNHEEMAKRKRASEILPDDDPNEE
jgi:hypothetical protein